MKVKKQRGQILVLFMLSLVVLIAMVALWSTAGEHFLLKPDRTTHVAIPDNTVRGVMVQFSKPETATFTRVLGFKIFLVFARSTTMFGVALNSGTHHAGQSRAGHVPVQLPRLAGLRLYEHRDRAGSIASGSVIFVLESR